MLQFSVRFLGCIALCIGLVAAYPNGMISGSGPCDNMQPNHGASASSTPAPYEITVSDTSYTPGSTIQVTVRATGAQPFRGFLLQPLSVNDETVRVGDFTASADTRLTCSSNGGKTIAHNSRSDKTSVTFTWTAPNSGLGNFKFKMTVVQIKVTYWKDVYSQAITGPGSVPTTTTTTVSGPSTPQGPISDVDLTLCGNSKSCMRNPPDCVSNCIQALTWVADSTNTYVDFEYQVSLTSSEIWSAFGISQSTAMDQTSLVDCVYNKNTGLVQIQMSYNTGYSNAVLGDPTLGLVPSESKGYYVDGKIICKFRRLIKLGSTASGATDAAKVFDLDTAHYLLLGQGFGSNNGDKSGHSVTPKTSSKKHVISSRTFINVGGTTLQFPLVKAHGTLMLLAWMVLASSAILMPRYFKPAWPGKTWCGKAIWFQIHQPFMILVFFFTIAAFIVAFISAKGYSQLQPVDGQNVHPILGIIVTALVIINPVMAAFRCGPEHPRRTIFNWAHFLVGLLAHVLATVTMFLGVYIPKAAMPPWSKWVMVAYIIWHIIIEITLAVHMHIHKGKESSKAIEMSPIDKGTFPPTQPAPVDPGSGFKTTVCIIHFAGVLALALALIVPLNMA